MQILSKIIEILLSPFLKLIDSLIYNNRPVFSSLSKFISAFLAIILVAYLLYLLLRPLDEKVKKNLKGLGAISRLLILIVAIYLTYNIFSETLFIIKEGGKDSSIVRSDFVFIAVLFLVLYLEIGLFKKR